MAKEIPYFKFYPNDWTSGDITLESYELQGIFINITAYYWSKECDLTLVNLKKRFRGFEDKIDELITNKIIKLRGDSIIISFLDEQLSSKELQNAVNKMNGRKGGRPKKEKTEEKPNGFNFENRTETQTKPIDKDIDKDSDIQSSIVADKKSASHKLSLEERKKVFRSTLVPFTITPKNPNAKYDADMVKDFFDKWTEPNPAKTKMKFEMEKTWDVSLRLSTWKRRSYSQKTLFSNNRTIEASADDFNDLP